jgi:hypothetical protein
MVTKLRYITLLLCILVGCNDDTAPDPPTEVARLSIDGPLLKTPEGDVIELRGINWGWWGTAQSQDALEAVEMGANVVRMPFRWYFNGEGSDIRQTGAPGNLKPEGLAMLDQYIDWCSEKKLWIILFGGSDKGAGDADENYWTSPSLRGEFIETWTFLADRYKDKPYIAAYEILSEPHPKKPFTSDDLREFYEELITAIRKVDPNTPLMIGANDHYDINQLNDVFTTIDPKIIYTFNFYLPTDYVKPEKREEAGLPIVSYPGDYTDFDGNEVRLDEDLLNEMIQPALNFRDGHNVPVFVNQVGARSRCPGHLDYMSDVGNIFHSHHIPFTYWTFRTRDDENEYGLYWYDKKLDQYFPKEDQIELMTQIFRQP